MNKLLHYNEKEMNIIQKSEKYLLSTYNKNLVIDHGENVYLFDKKGIKYLDLISGIATCSVGHSNKRVIEAIKNQLNKVINPSNLYYSEEQAVLAEKLYQITKLERNFFSNSGTEAIECAIKIFRAYQKKKKINKYKILCFENSFHGRTYGSLSATYEKIYKEKFKPLLPGFIHVKYNSVEEIEKALKKDQKIGAIMLEPIQGEAGIIIPSEDYLKSVYEICIENDLILIIDEIQTGNGRTGKFFCYQHYNIMPDILVTAKGLANGIPIGLTICSEELNLSKKDHGSTFGGNSIACIAAIATIEEILRLMPYIKEKGNYFVKKLKEKLEIQNNYVYDVRGKGLMIGATLSKKYQKNVDELYKNCLINNVLVNFCHGKHMRLLPPLSIEKHHIDEGIEKLVKSFSLFKTQSR